MYITLGSQDIVILLPLCATKHISYHSKNNNNYNKLNISAERTHMVFNLYNYARFQGKHIIEDKKLSFVILVIFIFSQLRFFCVNVVNSTINIVLQKITSSSILLFLSVMILFL